ncbi:hypothetical protein SELR_26720 [Selenomonas ruminantium subsp. lactilytica TAM6421]|uniref:Colicin import membrane protein n=1 Tax=Selenomonas ruminantium subsp. lactilytica (strain NBRC 103574 / TAM6421) TaxID=927704 RepID=I0GUE3_SELRL|nr:cell envelope integrity protein TolA [Selenomonas ruminantium]BAL84380.1 hypothetical protein SELR_26720 [Selenomonas ruminantium subsp. lactilytica TAM6421]
MTFILITGSIMTISIFLIYRLCHFFGIEMKWTSLALCAVMALLVNGLAITMSPFLDKGHYLRLGILVVTAAAVVTFFNERMLRREEAIAGGCTVLHTEALPPEDQPAPPPEDTILEARRKTAPADLAEKPAAESPEKAAPTEATPAAPAKQAAQKAIAEAEEAARIIAQKAEAKAKAEEEAKAKAKAEKAAKLEAKRKAQEEAARKKAEEQAKAAAAAKAKAEAEEKAKAEAAAKAKAQAEEKARKKAEAAARKEAQERKLAEKRRAHEQELKAELSAMDSLDALLDFAYEAKDAQPKDAIFAYHEAIDRYSDDDYTPFLVIELGNLYKEQANYSGAIATYKKALDIPIIAQNDAMCQEFTKNIHYLGTVQDILAKHAALSTPFPQIPGNIMQEIEDEFQAHKGSAK